MFERGKGTIGPGRVGRWKRAAPVVVAVRRDIEFRYRRTGFIYLGRDNSSAGGGDLNKADRRQSFLGDEGFGAILTGLCHSPEVDGRISGRDRLGRDAENRPWVGTRHEDNQLPASLLFGGFNRESV